ncbi:MAG: type I restriction enzyme HsdR N-terminal domain-containing protein [Bacteroidota bacterium]
MSKLPFKQLNLPPAELKISEKESALYVFDIVRQKSVKLEPEEWVRQHLVHYLIEHLNYPRGLMSIEMPVDVNSLNQRADIVVYDTNGKPFLLAECKSYSVDLDSATLQQAIRYNKSIQADYIILSNGLEHNCLKWNKESGMLKALEAFPDYVKNN